MRFARGRVAGAAIVVVLVLAACTPAGSERSAGPTGGAVRPLGPGAGDPDAAAAGSSALGGAAPTPVAGPAATPGLSRPLGSLGRRASSVLPWVRRELTVEADPDAAVKPAAEPDRLAGVVPQPDGALQTARGAGRMPSPSLSFGGQRFKANGPRRLVPPDPNGDVGLTQYVQAVNLRFSVYDKTTGRRTAGPTAISSLFTSGGPSAGRLCSTHDDGDPVVVYDPLADRWVLSQFALNFTRRVFAECIAVSKTANAAGRYWVYQFMYPRPYTFDDYPKLGVWPDGYYATFNQFHVTAGGGFSWAGAGAIAYDRTAMLAGAPASQIYVDLFPVDPNLGGMLPSDLDGPAPPAGAPNVFAQMDPGELGYPQDQLELWAFHADFATPENSAFDPIATQTLGNALLTAAFDPFICGGTRAECVPQRGTKNRLDTLSDRIMFRLQYRYLGPDDDRLTLTQSVRAGRRAGVRWYVLQGDDTLTAWSILDQGTYAPADGRSRWMGSAALDGAGDLAVGYSVSGPKTYPSIAYAGKPAADVGVVPGLTLGERRGFTGTGSEAGAYGRWGDYSDLTVDPTDDCTFYYTNEYYGTTGQWGWKTRVVAFEIPGCS